MSWEEQLVHLAEISGVFVGFAALISIRGSGAGPYETTFLRWVVVFGLVVVATALAPVAVANYGATGHEMWFSCSLFFIVMAAAAAALLNLTPENRTLAHSMSRREAIPQVATFGVALVLWLLALLLILLGVLPGHDAALYVTAEVLFLLETGLTLIVLVMSQFRPRERNDDQPRADA